MTEKLVRDQVPVNMISEGLSPRVRNGSKTETSIAILRMIRSDCDELLSVMTALEEAGNGDHTSVMKTDTVKIVDRFTNMLDSMNSLPRFLGIRHESFSDYGQRRLSEQGAYIKGFFLTLDGPKSLPV